MKVLHINFSEKGGAAIGLRRLHKALKLKNIESEIFNFDKYIKSNKNLYSKIISSSIWKIQIFFKKIILKFFVNLGHKETVSLNLYSPINYEKIIRDKKADIVHLHWVGNEMISPKSISNINRPLFWTMHDMWTFTGGCYYAKECRKFELGCGACPALETSQGEDHTAGDAAPRRWQARDDARRGEHHQQRAGESGNEAPEGKPQFAERPSAGDEAYGGQQEGSAQAAAHADGGCDALRQPGARQIAGEVGRAEIGRAGGCQPSGADQGGDERRIGEAGETDADETGAKPGEQGIADAGFRANRGGHWGRCPIVKVILGSRCERGWRLAAKCCGEP
jgi:hypothetical protein